MSLLKGKLYIIAAPSGAGKTSLVKALVESTRHIKVSISHTTRPKRTSEIDGINYHFTNIDTFKNLKKNDQFIECAEVFGNFYGTSKNWVYKKLNEGEDVILEIDWQGAQQIKSIIPESSSIFILPPSLKILKERLINRASDDKKVIEKRIDKAIIDISHYQEFDYLVINDQFYLALRDLQTIIRSRRLSTNWMKNYKQDFINSLIHPS